MHNRLLLACRLLSVSVEHSLGCVTAYDTTQSRADRALFLLQMGDSRMHALVHPEAVVITTNSQVMAVCLLTYLSQYGLVSGDIQPHAFLGISVQQSEEGTLWLHQEELANSLVREGSKPQPNWGAVEQGLQVLADCTRPDLVFPLSQIDEVFGGDRVSLLKEALLELDESISLGLVYDKHPQGLIHQLYTAGPRSVPSWMHTSSVGVLHWQHMVRYGPLIQLLSVLQLTQELGLPHLSITSLASSPDVLGRMDSLLEQHWGGAILSELCPPENDVSKILTQELTLQEQHDLRWFVGMGPYTPPEDEGLLAWRSLDQHLTAAAVEVVIPAAAASWSPAYEPAGNWHPPP